MEPLAADLAAREILLMAVNTAEHIKPSKPPGTLSIQNEYKVKAKIAVHLIKNKMSFKVFNVMPQTFAHFNKSIIFYVYSD